MPKPVQPVPLDTTVPTSTKKTNRLSGLGIGCGVLALLIGLGGLIIGGIFQSERQQPLSAALAVNELAGVPLYPGATVDTDATKDERAGLRVARVFHAQPGKLATVTCLRTNDSEEKIVPFYDQKMAAFGFQKTTLGGDLSTNSGASYVRGETRVVIQVRPDPGEEQKLLVFRFDGDSRAILEQPGNVVTPEDFQRALKQKNAAKKP